MSSNKRRTAARELFYAATHLWRAAQVTYAALMSREIGLVLVGAIAGGFLAALILAYYLPCPTATGTGMPVPQGLGLPDWIQAFSAVVQAIAAIVAIGVAIGLAMNERSISRRERKHDRELVNREKADRVTRAHVALTAHFEDCMDRMKFMKEQMLKYVEKDGEDIDDARSKRHTAVRAAKNLMPLGLGFQTIEGLQVPVLAIVAALGVEKRISAIRSAIDTEEASLRVFAELLSSGKVKTVTPDTSFVSAVKAFADAMVGQCQKGIEVLAASNQEN